MRFTGKALLGTVLAGILAVSASAGFEKAKTYDEGLFTDVPAAEWYAAEVKNTYELGLMNGIGGGLFDPDGNVTVAEAITMASRAASINAGETIPNSDGEWYQMYVNYATSKGFVKEGQFDNFERPAKRYEVASLFENAMPDGYFTAKNDVTVINDVSENQPYHDDLITLYKAGVIMGSDAYGNFNPENNITRAEAAAIINRVALPENRLSKSLLKTSDDQAYILISNQTYSMGARAGINSGWLLDNRGGAPRRDILTSYDTIYDIRKDAGVALIRELNKTTEGNLLLRTKLTVSEPSDGICLEFQNEAGQTVYRLETKDNAWQMLNADGSYTKLYDIANNELVFVFHIGIDLDNGTCTTNINYKECAPGVLATKPEDTNLMTFRFATTDENISTIVPGVIEASVNYGVIEDFTFVNGSSVPHDWTATEGASVKGGELVLQAGQSAQKGFNPIGGTVISKFYFSALNREKLEAYIMGSGKTVGKFESDGTDFYLNGVKIYENYVPETWYYIIAYADTEKQEITLKINGKDVAAVPFAEAASSVNSIMFANTSEAEAGSFVIDGVRVYREGEYDDYVPVPVKPAGEEKYNVGINVCSIWQNGFHHGWNVNSPYADREPVLGYYEEGSPEIADWEIKYMVEHGIDFQAYCWYPASSNAPLKPDIHMTHLLDGFMCGEYSDMMKFCIIWEAGNGKSPENMDAWKKYYVPAMIEQFFTDDRYMIIDNKPVMAIFGFSNVVTALGGEANVNEAFTYLREEVKKLGFDGVIILSSHASNSASLKNSGLDGAVAYNWGTSGYDLEHNKNSIVNNQNAGYVYVAPTISVGFNSIPWWGIRYPMMSMEDYAAAQKWVKDEYLPTYALKDDVTWNDNFVWLSTWNEYGEGTFIMPTTDEKGFGYLDVLREAYTDEKADDSVNTVPTEEQKARIGRRYPQYRHLLRREGYLESDKAGSLDKYETIYTVDFTLNPDIRIADIENRQDTALGLAGTSGKDAMIYIDSFDKEINLKDVAAIKINITAPKGQILSFFHISTDDGTWNEEKRINKNHTVDGNHDIVIYANELKKMTGTLTGVRIDPVNSAGNNFIINSIEFLKAPKTTGLIIDGYEYDCYFVPEKNKAGAWVLPFDPGIGLEFALNSFYRWDKENKVLELDFKGHSYVFTAGSSKYILDGTEKDMGFVLELKDDVPMLPIEMVCKEIGYKFEIVENEDGEFMSISTNNADFYEGQRKAAEIPGNWDFETPGDRMGWGSGNMSLMVSGGNLKIVTLGNSQNVQILLNDLSLVSEQFKTLEFKVKYNYDLNGNTDAQDWKLYYLTDRDPIWNEEKTLKVRLNSSDSGDKFETYTIDLSEYPLFDNTITNLRLDPFNGYGFMEFEYIKFTINPDYVYVDPDTLPFSVENHDAEGEKLAFTSNNGVAEIVEDPENAGNHCYRVISNKPGERNHPYLIQGVRYKAGATYIVEADVRIYAHDQETELSDDFSAQILCNAQFADPTTGKVDHVVGRVTINANTWGKLKAQFTIPANASDRSKDVLSFYADPVDNVGTGYYLDNIKVTEVLPE